MAMVDDTLQLIKESEEEYSELHTRQEEDSELYNLVSYVMKDEKNKKVSEAFNVTHNKPRTDAIRVISSCSSAVMQKVIEGEGLSDKRTTEIEEGLEAIEEAIDNFLPRRGVPNLRWFEAEQLAIRGGVVARSTPRLDDEGNFIPDILPCDFYNFRWDQDITGMLWGAYKTHRTTRSVRDEYGKEIEQNNLNIPPSSSEIEVIDFWDKEVNKVYLGGALAFEQPNPYGFVPFVFQPSVTSTTLTDKNSRKHFAESIYASDRELFREYNRSLSITQTLTVSQFMGAMQKETEPGEGKHSLPPRTMRTVTPYKKGTAPYLPMPLNDLHGAARLGTAILSQAIQQGLLSDMEYGNLTFPLSAVALGKLQFAKDLILIPILQAIALFRRQWFAMIIKQIELGDFDIKLPKGLRKVHISPETFAGDYIISHKFRSTSPEMDIANVSVASSMGNLVSDDYKRREILGIANPQGEEMALKAEIAEMSDPVLAQYNFTVSLIGQDRDIEAWLAFDKLKKMLAPQPPIPATGGAPQPIVQPQTQAQPIVPLLGKGGAGPSTGRAGGQRRRASEQEMLSQEVE